jgi:ATP-binding cassette subfamily C protein PrsD
MIGPPLLFRKKPVSSLDKSEPSDGNIEVAEQAFSRCRGALIAVGCASALINILYLTSSFFMLQVYDRVIPSRSIPTLIALCILALLLYAFQGVFEVMRSRMLVRIAGVFDEVMSGRLFRAILKAPVKTKVDGDGLQPMRDFDQVRTFVAGPGPAAFFDLPWVPFYIAICFMFHAVIGTIAILGALLLMVLTYLTNRSTQGSAKRVFELGVQRNGLLQSAQRNAEVVQAMGMGGALARIWMGQNDQYREQYRLNTDVSNGFSTLAKIFRMALQSATLAAGAVLVIENQASGGIIIASSILTSRALAPVDQAISNWRGVVSANQSWKRLKLMLKSLPETIPPLALAPPQRDIRIEALYSGPPGKQEVVVSNVSFGVRAGSAVGIIGPSGSGKSSLSRAIAGVWPIYRGSVRFDGAALDQWDDHALGRHIGYLPQDIELFGGTIAQNISRFDGDADPAVIIAASRAAGVHDLVVRLPKGYETQIGPGGSMLSAGQRQRVALARALYGDPFLVILDEPNSNLDTEGEAALSEAILGVRERGGIVLVVAHRPSALAGVNYVLMMKDGQVAAFGPKDEVLSQVVRPDQRPLQADRLKQLKIVGEPQEQ